MIADQNHGAHSAQVEMQLIINGSALSVTHMGPDFLLLESPADQLPCQATLVLQVDDSERRWQVRLPEGISKDSQRVALALSNQPESSKSKESASPPRFVRQAPPAGARRTYCSKTGLGADHFACHASRFPA